jgi:N-acetylglucosaminyldiphosphoundecaprenol N-acetyl-beta-D-mannosaminyltransferase
LLPFTALLIVERGPRPPVALVSVEGHLDVSYNENFKRLCAQALEATPFVIVNLERARFLDSSIIGTLVAVAKQARDTGGELRLAATPAPVRRTLEMLRMDRFFKLDDTIDVGLAQLPQRAEPAPLERQGSWSVFRTPRRFDAATAPELVEQGADVLEENAHLILDLTETDFLTSAGLAALVQLQRRASEKGGALRLVANSPDILRVLHLVRFDSVFPIYAELGEAVSAPLRTADEEVPV